MTRHLTQLNKVLAATPYETNLELQKEVEQGTLRIGLAKNIHVRIFPLFKNYECFEKVLIDAFDDFLHESRDYLIVNTPSSYTVTGCGFRVAVPLASLLFYSSDTYLEVGGKEELIPYDAPIIVCYADRNRELLCVGTENTLTSVTKFKAVD